MLQGKTFTGDRKKQRIHIAEVIIHHRGPHPRRQLAFGIVDLAPEFVPHLLQLTGAVGKAHINFHFYQGIAHARYRRHFFQLLQLLHGFLNDFGHLFCHLLRQGTGIRRGDHRLANHKLRIFKPAQALITDIAAHQQQQTGHPGNGAPGKGMFSNIHGKILVQGVDDMGRTFIPSRS